MALRYVAGAIVLAALSISSNAVAQPVGRTLEPSTTYATPRPIVTPVRQARPDRRVERPRCTAWRSRAVPMVSGRYVPESMTLVANQLNLDQQLYCPGLGGGPFISADRIYAIGNEFGEALGEPTLGVQLLNEAISLSRNMCARFGGGYSSSYGGGLPPYEYNGGDRQGFGGYLANQYDRANRWQEGFCFGSGYRDRGFIAWDWEQSERLARYQEVDDDAAIEARRRDRRRQLGLE